MIKQSVNMYKVILFVPFIITFTVNFLYGEGSFAKLNNLASVFLLTSFFLLSGYLFQTSLNKKENFFYLLYKYIFMYFLLLYFEILFNNVGTPVSQIIKELFIFVPDSLGLLVIIKYLLYFEWIVIFFSVEKKFRHYLFTILIIGLNLFYIGQNNSLTGSVSVEVIGYYSLFIPFIIGILTQKLERLNLELSKETLSRIQLIALVVVIIFLGIFSLLFKNYTLNIIFSLCAIIFFFFIIELNLKYHRIYKLSNLSLIIIFTLNIVLYFFQTFQLTERFAPLIIVGFSTVITLFISYFIRTLLDEFI